MPSPERPSYRTSAQAARHRLVMQCDALAEIEQMADIFAVLWMLDLEPAREILQRGTAMTAAARTDGTPWLPPPPALRGLPARA